MALCLGVCGFSGWMVADYSRVGLAPASSSARVCWVLGRVVLVKVAPVPVMRLVSRTMRASSARRLVKLWQVSPRAVLWVEALRLAESERSAAATGSGASGGCSSMKSSSAQA